MTAESSRRNRALSLWLLAAGLTCAVGVRAQTPAPAERAGAGGAEPAVEATPPLAATLTAGGRTARVRLVGVSPNRVAYTDPDQPGAPSRLLPKEAIEEAYFDLDIQWVDVDEAVAARNWLKAAGLLLPPLQPAMPYLDLPNNNAVEAVVMAGDCMMRAAEAERRQAKTPEAEESVRKKYEAAYAILQKAVKARWSSKGVIAEVKSVRCLLELDKPRTARRQFEMIEEPFPGDAAYGIYWLVKADLEARKGDFRAAMESVVKSVAFENKDIDTFPDALLLSARCYEELQEWHRARDVYYEVARLFPRTDWSDAAAQRLEFILEKGYTREPEKLPIENVFFKLQDDVNQLATQYLEARRKGTEVDDYTTYAREEEPAVQEVEEEEGRPGTNPPAGSSPGTPQEPGAGDSPKSSRPVRLPEVIQAPGKR